MSSCISVQGIEMRFRGCEALQGVNLEVPTGSVFALLGENGAGKTTLIRILTGFQKPTRGQCKVCGLDPAVDALEIRRRVGYVSDSPALYDWMCVGEIGWFAASFFDDAFANRYRELIARYELPESRKIRHLSKGQRAKVALSLAVSHDPELLILDEPTSGLDPLVRREFLESMVDRAATGRTVLLSSHQISEVERVADRVAILRAGRVQLVDELAELKDSICVVTITVDDPLATLPTLPGSVQLLSEQNEGRQRRWMVRGLTAEHVVELESLPNVASVRTRAASLEEMFVACTRGIVPLRVAESSAAPPFTEPRSAVPT